MYGTDGVSFAEKIIHQKWYIPGTHAYWCIAEINPENNLAFGYANLGNDDYAEWGTIDLTEIKRAGAIMESPWTLKKFGDVNKHE